MTTFICLLIALLIGTAISWYGLAIMKNVNKSPYLNDKLFTKGRTITYIGITITGLTSLISFIIAFTY